MSPSLRARVAALEAAPSGFSGTVRDATAASPLNTAQILQGQGGYDVRSYGIPNVAAVGNLDYGLALGGLYSDGTTTRNRFLLSAYVENDQAQPTVAVFGMGKGNHVWGANLVGYTKAAADAAIGIELDYGNVGNVGTTLTGDHVLPVGTVNVASTAGAAAPSGVIAMGGNFGRYTGLTATSYTGVTWEEGPGGTVPNGTSVFASVGGTATGLLIVAEGGNVAGAAPGPYVQLQANAASEAANGILFNGSGRPAVLSTGSLIKAANERAAIGLNLSGSKFLTTALYVPVNSGDTTATFGLILEAQGGAANAGEFIDMRASGAGSSVAHGIVYRLSGGVQPITGDLVRVSGAISCANGLNLSAATFSGAALLLGAGHNLQLDSTTGTKIGTGVTQKLGFWNAAPVAKPAAITGSRGSATATVLAALLTALASTGLITDSSTA